IIPLAVPYEDTRQTEVRNPARCRNWRTALEAVVFTRAGEMRPLDEDQASCTGRLPPLRRPLFTATGPSGYARAGGSASRRSHSDNGLLQNRSPALAGIIGARLEWTAAMISSVSIPCR